MIPYSYGWEKLHCAVSALVGSGSLDERLVHAFVDGLIHINKERDLPPALHDQFETVLSALPRTDAHNGRIKAAVELMDEMQQSRLSHEIQSLYDSICRVKGELNPDDYL